MPADEQQRFHVVLVCMGNICRSPMAASVLRRQLTDAELAHLIEVESAGTAGWHAGDSADPRAIAALARRGYDTTHAARQFQAAWFSKSDLVVALDLDNQSDLRRLAPTQAAAAAIRLLGEFDPQGLALQVADPYYGGDDGFEAALDQIERCCEGLTDYLRGQTSVTTRLLK